MSLKSLGLFVAVFLVFVAVFVATMLLLVIPSGGDTDKDSMPAGRFETTGRYKFNGYNIRATCDHHTKNLIYTYDRGITVVENGCN